jgi:hypothetical protein
MFSCLIRACSFMEVMFFSLTLTFSSFMRAGFECFPTLGRVYEIKSVFEIPVAIACRAELTKPIIHSKGTFPFYPRQEILLSNNCLNRMALPR